MEWKKKGKQFIQSMYLFSHSRVFLWCGVSLGVFPAPQKVDAPKTVRPSTQLGFELRARRRNNDWGLGEGGRPRREADIAVNKRFPLWGCVDGKVMQHEKPSALEVLEELKANEEDYRAGKTKRKNMYATAKDVDKDSKTFRILSTNAEAGRRGPGSGTGSGTGIGNGRGVSASATVTRALPRLAEEASASHRAAARAAAAHLYVRQQEEETRRRRQGREAVGPGSGSTVGDGGHGDAMAPRRGAHKRQPSEAKNDPRIAELTREMYELAGVTAQLAAFREQRQGTLAAADALAASGSLPRLPSPSTLRGRRTIIDRRHAEIAGKVNAKLEAAMSEKTARCVALSGTLTAEYGDLSNLV